MRAGAQLNFCYRFSDRESLRMNAREDNWLALASSLFNGVTPMIVVEGKIFNYLSF